MVSPTTSLQYELASCNYVPEDIVASPRYTGTLLECAALCFLDTCLSVVFDGLRNECYLNTKTVNSVNCAGGTPLLHVVMYNKLGVVPGNVSSAVRCPSVLEYDYEDKFDICYKHHYEPLSYSDALEECIQEGGTRLLRVDNEDIDFYLYVSGYGGFLEGMYDEAEWRYADGAILTYSNWYPGHPVVNRKCIKKAGPSWSSVSCTTGELYSCEYLVNP